MMVVNRKKTKETYGQLVLRETINKFSFIFYFAVKKTEYLLQKETGDSLNYKETLEVGC